MGTPGKLGQSENQGLKGPRVKGVPRASKGFKGFRGPLGYQACQG